MENQQESSLVKWKILTDFPTYEIGSDGTIRNFSTKVSKYTLVSKNGYEYVQFKVNGKVVSKTVHRLVATAFLEPPPQWMVDAGIASGHGCAIVNHKDGVKTNNNIENLEWCSNSENMAHAARNGLYPSRVGEKSSTAKLSEELVHKVCKAFEDGMMPKEAVLAFGISRQQATKIRAGYAWTHISEQYNIKVNKRKSSTTSHKA